MTPIRINPSQVRGSGVAAVTSADDLRAQATLLQAVILPAMPPAIADRHRATLDSIATRLRVVANEYASTGEELQIRAAAAEVADAPGEPRSVAAGRELGRAVTTTATIVGTGGTRTAVQLRTTRSGTTASTSSGLRLIMPAAIDVDDVASGKDARRPRSTDPHHASHERPAVAANTEAHQEIGGAPALAVQHALAAVAGGAGGMRAARAMGAAIDPSSLPAGEHRAESVDSAGTPVAVHMPPAHESDRQHWACWMAGTAAHDGLPPTLPVMMALSQTGMHNMPAGHDDAGFFGLDPAATYAPAGFGVARDTTLAGDWWTAHPDAQLDHVLGRLGSVGGGIRTADLADPAALGRWAADAAPHVDPAQLADAHTAASALVAHCQQSHAGGPVASGGALSVARSQLGVHEFGEDMGPQVNRYLAAADVGPGNPWCASFVTWSLHESGHDMPGTGWAAVSNWVHAAETGQHGMQLVDPSAARPGDIVAYDWGGQNDFSGDGHIGFLDSTVHDGRFTAVEGNASDAVTRMDRSLDSAHVVFIRMAA